MTRIGEWFELKLQVTVPFVDSMKILKMKISGYCWNYEALCML